MRERTLGRDHFNLHLDHPRHGSIILKERLESLAFDQGLLDLEGGRRLRPPLPLAGLICPGLSPGGFPAIVRQEALHVLARMAGVIASGRATASRSRGCVVYIPFAA